MKILHICQRDDPSSGGALRVAEALMKEQLVTGIDVWLVFLYGKPGQISSENFSRVICLELDSSHQAIKGFFLLFRLIKQISPDIIHSHDGIYWPRLVLIFMLRRIAVITHAHSEINHIKSIKDWIGWLLIKKTTSHVIGVSLHTIGTWIRAGFPQAEILHIPNGVDCDRFFIVEKAVKSELRKQLGLPKEKKILLWVGRLHQSMKGLDRVERIARLLPENAVLVVVGDGPDGKLLAQRNAELIDSEMMFMVGATSYPEKYYMTADAFLFSSYYEPFGLVILEAAACGLPVIAFPLRLGGGAVELISEFGAQMIDDGDSNKHIQELLLSWLMRNQISCSVSQHVLAAYSWKSISYKITTLYDSMISKSS